MDTVRASGFRCGRKTVRRAARVTAVAVTVIGLLLGSAVAFGADALRGGAIYDKWWVVSGAPEPQFDHPLYPAIGQKSGSTTYRCKECHGWDYKGVDGAYGSGSHFTGIPGVFGSSMTAAEMFAIIKNPDGNGTGGTTVNGHDFGTYGLVDADIDDVVEFLMTLVVDTDTFIDGSGQFLGNEAQGDLLYNGDALCFACHGVDGTSINFGTPEEPEWVGTIAVGNPWEFLHKVRFGQPDQAMPSLLQNNGTDQEAADIGLYAQLNLPTEPADMPEGIPTVSEWGMILMGLLLLGAGARIFSRSS